MAGAAQPGIQFENGAAGTIWNASNVIKGRASVRQYKAAVTLLRARITPVISRRDEDRA